MASYTWTTGTSGNWATATNWSGQQVPNNATADVTIDAPAPTGGSYTVSIASGETFTVNSLAVNPLVNAAGTNADPYNAAKLEIDGTLVFAPGSDGLLDGPRQTFIGMNGGKIVNAGTINGFIQAQGDVLFTGTNGFYVTNWLQAQGGVVTVDAPIAEVTAGTLLNGIFEAQGEDSAIRLGGSLTDAVVNISTITGPTANPDGLTEVIWNDAASQIQEWNGSSYVSLETTLKEIGNRGTVDVLAGRNYTSTSTLAITDGMLNLAAGTVTVAALNINNGIVQGSAAIAANVVNNGTLTAIRTGTLAAQGTLSVTGTLSGTGKVNFDQDHKPGGTLAASGATLALSAVTTGQTIVMDGNDTLILNTPSAFAGGIQATVGDRLILNGINATGATVNGDTLVVTGAAGTLATLHLVGNYSTDHFVANGSTLTVASGPPTPTPTPTPTPVSSNQLLLQNNDGSVAAWQMNGTTVSSFGLVGGNPGPDWFLKGTGAFYTGDTADYVWQNSNGQVAIWQVQGTNVLQGGVIANLSSDWHVKGTGNFYNDGHSAIVWQNDNGLVALWGMDGSTVTRADVLANPGADWHVKGTGNFYGNGGTDLLWQNDNGQVAVWDMNGSTIVQAGVVDGNAGPAWQVKGTGDFYGNGTSDVLLQNSNGQIAIWDMNGSTISQDPSGASAWRTWRAAPSGSPMSCRQSKVVTRS